MWSGMVGYAPDTHPDSGPDSGPDSVIVFVYPHPYHFSNEKQIFGRHAWQFLAEPAYRTSVSKLDTGSA